MKKSCLIYVIAPLHAVTAICAVRALHPDLDVEVTVVVQWPGSNISDELAEIIRNMLRPYPYVRAILALGPDKLDRILEGGTREAVKQEMRRELPVRRVDEIYYPHDVLGLLYQTLCTAYPGTRRICYGDGIGFVYERKVRLSYVPREAPEAEGVLEAGKKLAAAVVGRARGLLQKRKLVLEDFPPHLAVLVLPVDQSGKFLENLPFAVCPQDDVFAVLKEQAEACRELQAYMRGLFEKYSSRKMYLLPTENNAEAGFIELDREVEMYCSLIRKHCEPGSVVFLKSHPAELLPRNERIQERLGKDYEIVQLDKSFRRYPIELWRDLVLGTTVVCMSLPVLTLKFLYGIDVIQPMDHAFIEHWFPEKVWVSYKNAILLYMESLRLLATWDGNSVLFSGKLRAE